MSERDDTETPSYREEQGKEPAPADPRERQADVPLAPSTAGVVGAAPPADAGEVSTVDAERDAAAAREHERE